MQHCLKAAQGRGKGHCVVSGDVEWTFLLEQRHCRSTLRCRLCVFLPDTDWDEATPGHLLVSHKLPTLAQIQACRVKWTRRRQSASSCFSSSSPSSCPGLSHQSLLVLILASFSGRNVPTRLYSAKYVILINVCRGRAGMCRSTPGLLSPEALAQSDAGGMLPSPDWPAKMAKAPSMSPFIFKPCFFLNLWI